MGKPPVGFPPKKGKPSMGFPPQKGEKPTISLENSDKR